MKYIIYPKRLHKKHMHGVKTILKNIKMDTSVTTSQVKKQNFTRT